MSVSTFGQRRARAVAFGNQPAKRVFDLLVASSALLVSAPIMVAGGLAVKLTSPGPVFYRARRAGVGGKPFDMLKLRTMVQGSDRRDMRVTSPDDARITPVGALLRKAKVDELPQFWNVLRGEMSIVGPRPEDWDIVQEHFTLEQRQVLDARPGIVSPVDLNWYPDLTYHDPPPAGVSMQSWYIERHMPLQVAEGRRYLRQQSLLLDLKVLAQTIGCILLYTFVAPAQRSVPIEGEITSPEPLQAAGLGGIR